MEMNPYATPAPAPAAVIAVPESPRFRQLAKLSWQLPLGGLLFIIAMNVGATWLPPLDAMGFLVFAGCTLVGLVLAMISIVAGLKYRGVLAHAIGGLVTNGLIILLIAALIGLMAARDAERRMRVKQNLDQLQQGIERYEQDKSAE